jgi:hypothetical protein
MEGGARAVVLVPDASDFGRVVEEEGEDVEVLEEAEEVEMGMEV